MAYGSEAVAARQQSQEQSEQQNDLDQDAMVTERRDCSSVYNETANSNAQVSNLQTSMQAYTAAQA